MAKGLKDCSLLSQEVTLLKRLGEVEFGTYLLSLYGKLFFLCIFRTVAHLYQLVHGPLEASNLHVLINLGSEWIFYGGVATWITNLNCKWELLTIDILLDLGQKYLEFLELLRLMDLPQRLMEFELLVGPKQVSLDCVDFSLAIGWNLQIDLLKMYDSVLRLDEFPVEITLAEHSEQDIHSKVAQFAGEVALIVAISALLACERGDHDLSEEGDLGEENGGEAVLLTVYTHGLDCVCWVRKQLRYSKFFMSAKMTSGAFFFCIVDELQLLYNTTCSFLDVLVTVVRGMKDLGGFQADLDCKVFLGLENENGVELWFGGSDWSLQDYFKMEPIAYLALLNLPGQNKLKNLRYFLGRGDNIVGSDPRCQIIVPSKYQLPNYIANIRIGFNFITIQALHSHLIYVEGNLAKFHRDPQTDNFFMLALNTQYIPKVGEFFFIGRIKAVVGAVPHHELVMMRNVVNQVSFRRGLTEREELQKTARELNLPQAKRERNVQEEVFQNVTLEQDYFPFGKKEHNEEKEQLFQEFASSQVRISDEKSKQKQQQLNVVDQEQKSHTEVLDEQNYQQEATLVLEQGIYAYEPTINLDQPNFPEINLEPQPQPPPPVYSQQLLLNEIRMRSQSRSQNQPEQEDDFSMPDTIIDKENEVIEEKSNQQRPHIEQVQSKEEKIEEDQDDEMPPTIKEVDEAPSKIKPTKTMFNPPKSETVEERRLYKSGPLPKDSSIKSQASAQINPIQDFMDLFDLGEPASTNKSNLKHKMSEPLADSRSKDYSLMQMSTLKFTSLQEKEPQSNSPIPKKQESEAEPAMKLKVHFVGFKPTATHKDLLKKQHFETVTGPDEDYDILLVKQPLRISNRLLLALIDGKRIETEQWIFSKQAVIQSKLNGLTWKQIYEIKGNHKHLLKGKGKFYISKRLEEVLENVIESMGGQVVTELTDKRKVINAILRAEDSQDTQIYLQNHQNKKWRFLKYQAIIDAVLTGKFTLDKYLIKLFNQ